MATTSPKVTKIEIFDLQVIFLATIIIVRDVPPVLSSVNPVILATISDVDVRRLLPPTSLSPTSSVININVADFIIYFMRTYDSYGPQIDRLTVIDVYHEVDDHRLLTFTGELDLTAVQPRFITKLVLKHH